MFPPSPTVTGALPASSPSSRLVTVSELIASRASERPDAAAYIEGRSGRALTWGQIGAQAEAWRSAFGAGGSASPGEIGALGPQTRIGLLVSDPLTTIGAFLSALAAGVTVAPLNPDGTAAERGRQQAALGLSAVITDDPNADCAGLARWLVSTSGPGSLPRRLASPGVGAARGPVAPAGDAAVILASSGTTGTPKIIPLTEAQLLHTARSLVEHHRLDPDERGYCPLPLFHINALVVGVLSTLVAGSSLVVDRRFSASNFWAVVARHEVTWLNLVPAIIGLLADGDAPPAGTSARIAFARSASAPLPAATRQRFEERSGIGILETYGMTEAASQIAANPRDERHRRPGSVGRPVGLDARVVDRDSRAVPVGEVGQVQIRGASVVDRYWSPWTAEQAAPTVGGPAAIPATRDGWLDTGDLGWMDEDGYLYLVGRVDDVINRGGEKVFPRDVEEVLLTDADVVAAAVVGRAHPKLGQEPVAFVLARGGTDGAELRERLARLCERQLSRFRRPAAITVTDTLPMGPTGKIRHAALRRELADRAGSPYAPVAQGEEEYR